MIAADVQSLSAGAIIELFELDCTLLGGDVFRWTDNVNELGTDLVWAGNEYVRLPVEANGFERSGGGKQPRPTLKLANVGGLLGAQSRIDGGFLGAKLTRVRTLVDYLDAVNFSGGNAAADPAAKFVDEIWYVDRKSAENGIFIEFELATALDLAGVKIPHRQVVKSICPWVYRSGECGYAGGAVATDKDVTTTDLAQDKCGKRLGSCELRFGFNNPLPFGGFPGVGLL